MFFRVKLVTIFLGVVLLLLVLVHFLFLKPIGAEIEEQLQDQVAASVSTVPAMNRTDVLAVRRLAGEVATQSVIVQAMSQQCATLGDPEECREWRHNQVSQALGEWYRGVNADIERNRSRTPGTRDVSSLLPVTPTLLIVADPEGTVVGRAIGDTQDWWGGSVQNLRTYPVFEASSRGVAFDVIEWREGGAPGETPTLTLAGAAPIRAADGSALGMALVGFPLSDELAIDKQGVLGEISLAYTMGDTIAGSDLRPNVQSAILGARLRPIVGGDWSTFAEYNGDPNTLNQVYLADTNQGSYLLARGGIQHERAGGTRAGFLVVADLSAKMAVMHRVAVGLPVLGIILLALGLVAIIIIVRNFLTPLVKIDGGIQQVIVGNRDYKWEVDPNNPFTAEMAHALNVMSAFLQGKPLPDEDVEEDDSEWAALLQFADVDVTGSHPAINVKGIAQDAVKKKAEAHKAEPVELFHRRIFDEYVAARKTVDPNGEPVAYDRFVGQVKRNAAAFKTKHNCQDVRFEVVVKDDRVLLKPIPIK